jgi:hypothetical protein
MLSVATLVKEVNVGSTSVFDNRKNTQYSASLLQQGIDIDRVTCSKVSKAIPVTGFGGL